MIFNKKIKNKKAFTLIELLAVIVILGIIMLIAIPGVTGYITSSRKSTLLTTIEEYIRIANTEINGGTYHFFEPNRIYAIPIECLPVEKGGEDPFGEWLQANENYWAYVLAEYNPSDNTFTFGFTFKDSAKNGLYPTERNQIKADQIKDSYDDLTKPETGKAIEYMASDKWNGFTIDNNTELVVLDTVSTGADGKTTCVLCQKGSNYEEIENSKSKTFAEDSWETIIKAVKTGKTENYHVGDTKEVDMGTFGTHTIRVANTSTPAECSTAGFSQTACGFVLEFADIITTHNMNSTDTNTGGWPATLMRTYVNNDIYNALPSELKNGIIDTYVVSGHGPRHSANFTSTDKLYLLSTKEVWGKEGTSNVINYDTTDAYTRQLDYYKAQGVTTSNYSGAKKQYNGDWWLRAAYSTSSPHFYSVYTNGDWNNSYANNSNGVAPAFRIG